MTTTTKTEELEGQRKRMIPFLANFYFLIVAGLLLLMKGGGLGAISPLSGGGLKGSIADFAETSAKSNAYYGLQNNHTTLFLKLAKVTSRNQVKRDFFALQKAMVSGDEATALRITEIYKDVDFLPVYAISLDGNRRREVKQYANEKGRAATISKLMKSRKMPDSWPYRDHYLAALEENKKDYVEGATEVWFSCPIGKEPKKFVNISGTGLLAKGLIERTPIEDPSTAGGLTAMRDLSGEPMLDIYGQVCYLRAAYAKEWTYANQCVKESTGVELVFRYCYRPAEMQAVVRYRILGATPLGAECGVKLPGFVKSASYTLFGGGPAAPPGHSNHNFGGAVDVDFMNEDALRKCLPPHWDNSVEKDEGHWEVNPDREEDVVKDILIPKILK